MSEKFLEKVNIEEERLQLENNFNIHLKYKEKGKYFSSAEKDFFRMYWEIFTLLKPEEIERMLDSICTENEAFIAYSKHDQTIIGIHFFSQREELTMNLGSILVLPPYRRKGLGWKLVLLAISLIRSRSNLLDKLKIQAWPVSNEGLALIEKITKELDAEVEIEFA